MIANSREKDIRYRTIQARTRQPRKRRRYGESPATKPDPILGKGDPKAREGETWRRSKKTVAALGEFQHLIEIRVALL